MSTQPVRVMIVEDSTVVRTLLAHIVGRDPHLLLVAAVATAEEALSELARVAPDVISMDIRLPGMDGLEATRRIMADHPTPIVVIADAVTETGAQLSMNALRAGALSVVEKPVGAASGDYERISGDICTQLRIMSQVPVIRRRTMRSDGVAAPAAAPAAMEAQQGAAMIGLAASTGGPPALAKVLGALPADFPVPIVLVQHMGAAFMEGFAQWLDGVTALKVRLARDGDLATGGEVLVAPGDRHLTVTAGGVIRLIDSAPVDGQRPSATVMFRSMARALGPRAAVVLMTGMGEDGARGCVEVRQAGGMTITEHESSAVVYGMPAAAVRLGGSRASLPLELIGPRLARMAQSGAGK